MARFKPRRKATSERNFGMSKYVIKNCPATGAGCCGDTCPEITDCPLKQIVEICKRTLSINKGSENEFTLGKMTFAEFILKDIDIQEIE